MASSFEKSVKGATKIKAAPPKTKYIEHILIATHSGEHGVAEVFRSLQNRLRDSTWTVVFKSLITVHLMIREGSPDVTLAFLASHRNMLAISSFSDENYNGYVLTGYGRQVQTQGRNIRHYANYLAERAKAYRDTKCDYVRGAEHRFEKLTIEKGLLRETEVVQHQIGKLLKCDVLDTEPENEITITVFRMLVLDLLAMFHVVNQAMINILGHFFEMSRLDAERALGIYLDFTKQTDQVVSYLSTARQYQHQTRVEVPKLKHAPTNLGKQLEDYLADPDFEINRRQYIAEQDAKKGRGGSNGVSKPSSSNSKPTGESRAAVGRSFPEPSTTQAASAKPAQLAKGPDPDLIDFFDSIEQNQQPMATQSIAQQQANMPNFAAAAQYQIMPQQQFQQNGFANQPSGFQDPNQFQQPAGNTHFMQTQQNQIQSLPVQPGQQIQPNYTGAGFGGYTPQPVFTPTSLSPIPQDGIASFQSQGAQPFATMGTSQPQTQSNPFRQSMMTTAQTGAISPLFSASASTASPIPPQNTNPFKHMTSQPTSTVVPPQGQQGSLGGSSLQPTTTGTNPFARNMSQPIAQQAAATGLMPQPTGNTNPFRQSQFVNTATGAGWQHNQIPMGGGLDSLETVPVFPRPAQQQPWQQ